MSNFEATVPLLPYNAAQEVNCKYWNIKLDSSLPQQLLANLSSCKCSSI